MLVQLAPLLLIFVIFYFLLIRPQQKKMKEHRAMLEALKRGDIVVTTGGLIGKVVHVEDAELGLEIAPGVRVKIARGMVSSVRSRTEAGGGDVAKPVKEREIGAYYKALGVPADATTSEIEAAYQNKSEDAAAQEAYETLKNMKLRKLYDKLGHDEYVATTKN
jgi:preprotein translocase subunit YajC